MKAIFFVLILLAGCNQRYYAKFEDRVRVSALCEKRGLTPYFVSYKDEWVCIDRDGNWYQLPKE